MVNEIQESQWAYLLDPCFELSNSAGKPLTDGWIEVYIAGTRNKYYTASDFDGTLHPFKIPLDSLGANIVLASPDNAYDVYVYNKFGSLIMSRYNVKCQGGGGTSTVEYIGDRLEYGQYTARDVTTVARLLRQKGNINTTQDGFLKLKEDMSYHITVRGTFVCDHLDNVATSLNYIEYSSFNPIKVNIDETVSGEQHFELSYDIFRLPNDMDYQVGFDASNGHISSLAVEVHSLSNLNTTLQGGNLFEQGWGIIIDNNVISVDPSIFEEYPTFDDLQAAVTAVHDTITTETFELVSSVSSVLQDEIDNIQGGVQSDWEQDDPSEPDYIKNKPDLSEFATHDEVVSTVSSVSSTLQNEIDELPRPVNADWNAVSGLAEILNKPDLDIYATKEEVSTATSTIENEISEVVNTVCAVSSVLQEEIDNIPEQVQSDWNESDTESPAYIQNKPDLDVYATHDEVSGVSAVLKEIIDEVSAAVPDAQVQSDWTETDDTKKSYIQHKPEVKDVYAGENITLTETASGLEIAADGTDTETVSAIAKEYADAVSAAIPDAQVQSDWTETDDTKKSYIQHKPIPKTLVAGDGINITDTVTGVEISAAVTGIDGYVTEDEFIEVVSAVTGTGDYGQFFCLSASGACTMGKVKGTIDVTNDGKIKLKQGKSYHITVRGAYTQTAPANSDSPITFIEYVTNNPIGINVDRTTTTPQYFDLGFDLYGLSADTDYYVYFTDLAGTISNLFVEVHTILGGGGGNGGGGGSGSEYNQGWGIVITNNTISVNPSIIPDVSNLATKNEVTAAIATATGAQINADWNNSNPLSKAYIQNKPEEITLVGGNNVEIDIVGASAIISASVTGGGGGATYIAGEGIEIDENNVISVSGVAMASAVDAVSGKLPTTEIGKFIIQNNVTGGPIEVLVPTDQSPDAVLYQINSVTGNAYANAPNYSVVNYYYGETPADFNGSDDSIRFTINDNIANISSIEFYYITDVSSIGGPNLSSTSIRGDTSTHILQSGTYKVKAQYNQGVNQGYGKYLQIMFNWYSYAFDAAQSLQWAQEALSKITFFGIVRPDSSLGSTVNLDRYYLGNTSTTTNTYGLTQATIYTDSTTKKQSVYLPSSIPSTWNSAIIQSFEYGNPYVMPYTSEYQTKQYRAYKHTSSTYRYQFAYCTDWDDTNRLMTFVAYDNSGNAIEKWTVDYTTYGSAVWTTTPIGGGSNYTAGTGISIDANNVISVTGMATEVEIQAVSAAIPSLSGYATETYVQGAVSGKQDVLTGITDVQVVQSLPASPVSTVLYLIPEA